MIPESVLVAMGRAMPDLYEGELIEVANSVRSRLPSLVDTTGQGFIVNGNGHAAWQMATSNTLRAGDKVLVLSSRFADTWGRFTAVSGIEIETLEADPRKPFPPEQLLERLRNDNGTIAAVLCVHVDTASSVRNNIADLRRAIDDAGHDALLMVDCIASLGCEPIFMDSWGVDVLVSACQKGLMVPPGVSFVWANDRALMTHAAITERVGYLDWSLRLEATSFYSYFAGTPPVSHLYGLQEAFSLIDREGGLSAVWARHQILAEATRAAVQAWSSPKGISFNVVDADARSNCVTTVRTGQVDADRLRGRARLEAGLVIGLGLGEEPSIRIAHMGHLNPPTHLGTLATIEAVLYAENAPIGASGIQAATQVIGDALKARTITSGSSG